MIAYVTPITDSASANRGRSMMKMRMPIFIFFSMLMTLFLTACADATEVKLNASDGAANDYFGNSVSISGNETILYEKRCVDLTVKYNLKFKLGVY